MGSEKRIRVGVVGAGENTRGRHLPELQAIPGVEVVSVANRSRHSAEAVAREFGIPRVVDRWEDLVSAGDTDAIVIGTWPCMHAPVTLAALAAGQHVLCEARMAMDAAEARAMLAAARAHPELVTQIVPAPMSFGVDATIARLLAEGFLGDPLAIEVRGAGADLLDRSAPLHWRQDRTKSGLNTLALGIWYETVMRWVGPAVRVAAFGRTFGAERVDPETGASVSVRVPDHVDVLAQMACGAQARFQVSGVTGFAPPPDVWLFGSEGTLRYSPDDERLEGARRGQACLEPLEIPPGERGEWRVERDFVDAIRNGVPVRLTTFADGVRYMEFTEAVARSMQSQAAVALPLEERRQSAGQG